MVLPLQLARSRRSLLCDGLFLVLGDGRMAMVTVDAGVHRYPWALEFVLALLLRGLGSLA